LQVRERFLVRFSVVLHDGIISLLASALPTSNGYSALDVVADRLSAISDGVERIDDEVSWTLAGGQHTIRRIPGGLALETVLGSGCALGVRECEQTLNGANQMLALTRWIVDPD